MRSLLLKTLLLRGPLAPLALLPLIVACGGRSEIAPSNSPSSGDAAALSALSPHIYVADSYDHVGKLIAFDDMTGAGWETWNGGGSPISALCGVALDAQGRIYFGTEHDGLLRVDDISGAGLVAYASTPSRQVGAVAVDASGRIYGLHGNILFRIDDISGAGLAELGTPAGGSEVAQFTVPLGVAVSASGKILVGDGANGRVVEINDMSGAGWKTWTMPGTAGGGFAGPGGVAYDSAERIYAVDVVNSTLYRMDTISGDGLVSFHQPAGAQMTHVFVDSSGRIYMTMVNAQAPILAMNDMTGAGLASFGNHGDGARQFGNPCGIVVR